MKKKKYNFNNIKSMKDKKIVDPQEGRLSRAKAEARRLRNS
jgi:hypothetical protein